MAPLDVSHQAAKMQNRAYWIKEAVTSPYAAVELFQKYVAGVPSYLMEFIPAEYISQEEYAVLRKTINLDEEQDLVVRLGSGYLPPRGAIIKWGNSRSVNTLLAIESLHFENNFIGDSDSDDEDSPIEATILFQHHSVQDDIRTSVQPPKEPLSCDNRSFTPAQCEIESTELGMSFDKDIHGTETFNFGVRKQCEIDSPVLQVDLGVRHDVQWVTELPEEGSNTEVDLNQCEIQSPDLGHLSTTEYHHGGRYISNEEVNSLFLNPSTQDDNQSSERSLSEPLTHDESSPTFAHYGEEKQCEINSPVLHVGVEVEHDSQYTMELFAEGILTEVEFAQCKIESSKLIFHEVPIVLSNKSHEEVLHDVNFWEEDLCHGSKSPVLNSALDRCEILSPDLGSPPVERRKDTTDTPESLVQREINSPGYGLKQVSGEQCETKSPVLEIVPATILVCPIKVYPSASTEALFTGLANLAITSEVQKQITMHSELVDNFLSLPVDLFLETPVAELASLFVIMVEPYTKEFLAYNIEALSFFQMARELLHELLAKLEHKHLQSIVDLVLHILLVVRNFPSSAQQGVFFQLLGHIAARIFVCINPTSLARIWDHSQAAILQINRIIEQSPLQVSEGDTLGCFMPFVRLTSELTRLIFYKGEKLADILRDNTELLISSSGMYEWEWLRTSMAKMWEFTFSAWNAQELQVLMDPCLWGLPNFLFGHTEFISWHFSQYSSLDLATFPPVTRKAILEHERITEWNVDCLTVADFLENPGSVPLQKDLRLQTKQGEVNDKLAPDINLICHTDNWSSTPESVDVNSRIGAFESPDLPAIAVYLREIGGARAQHNLLLQMKRNDPQQGPSQDFVPICLSGNWSPTQEGAKSYPGSSTKEPPDTRDLVNAQTGNGLCHDDSKNKFSFRFLVIGPEMILCNQHLTSFTLRHAFKLVLGLEEHVFRAGNIIHINIENTDLALCFVPGGFPNAANLMEFFPYQVPQTINNLYFGGFGSVDKFKQTPYASVVAEGAIKLKVSDVFEYSIPKLHQECGFPLMTRISGNWFILGLHFSSAENLTQSFTSCISLSKLCLYVYRLCQLAGGGRISEGYSSRA